MTPHLGIRYRKRLAEKYQKNKDIYAHLRGSRRKNEKSPQPVIKRVTRVVHVLSLLAQRKDDRLPVKVIGRDGRIVEVQRLQSNLENES